MKHIIVVDDRSKAGKNLLELAEILAENDQSIFLLTEEEEDKAMLKKMLSSKKSGMLNASEKEAFLKQLRAQAGS
jgi:hypothetical protein